jgi:hypothetical protein
MKKEYWYFAGGAFFMLLSAILSGNIVRLLLYSPEPIALHAEIIPGSNLVPPPPESSFITAAELAKAAEMSPVLSKSVGDSGKASYYDYDLKDYPNYSKTHATAASRKYPRGSRLEVCRQIPVPGKPDSFLASTCVIVKVNDYGPDAKVFPDRIIDLSSYAFNKIASTRDGVVVVTVSKIQETASK